MQKIKKLFTLILAIVKNIFGRKNSVYYVTENADWIIKEIGNSLYNHIAELVITFTSIGIRNSVVHYASLNTFFKTNGFRLPHKSNKLIVTVFHISNGDQRANYIASADKYVDIWHTSCEITKKKLIEYGASIDKIVLIPIGFDIKSFFSLSDSERFTKRKLLNIPDEAVVIGSFQKDGNGWGEGLEPKLIKGPDLFCDVVEKIGEKYPTFVLLTGPARGYVKVRLRKAGIKFIHEYLDDPNDVGKYFQLCDLYLIASREEGGPRALLEAMATGVPLVSSKVGMAPDMINDGENGFLVNIGSVDEMYEKAIFLVENEKEKKKIIDNGLKFVKSYDYSYLSKEYMKYLYQDKVES